MSASPLTPTDLSHALDVYRSEGTYAAAARAIGRDESTVRKALRRHAAPARAELFAEELATAHVNALRATRKARRKALAALGATDDARDVALLAHVLHENLRAVSQARAAHGRIVATEVVVAVRVEEELRSALDRLRSVLSADAYTRALDALAHDSPPDTPMRHAAVVQYDADPSTLTDAELHARIATLVDRIQGDDAARVGQLSGDELDARTRSGLAALVARARGGNDDARRLLAPLVDAAQVPDDTPVILLPRIEEP